MTNYFGGIRSLSHHVTLLYRYTGMELIFRINPSHFLRLDEGNEEAANAKLHVKLFAGRLQGRASNIINLECEVFE